MKSSRRKSPLTASSFRTALLRLGIREARFKNVSADLEGVYESASRLVELLEAFVRLASLGERAPAGVLLGHLEAELLTHMAFHQRSLRRPLDRLLYECSESEAPSRGMDGPR